jgi:PPOX class probable F420-dependent enzyme
MQIPQSVRELVATAPLGHLTTINPDGSPEVTVIWVGIDNSNNNKDEFVIGHLGMYKKIQNIRRDPRVVLSMLGPNTNAQHLREYVVVYGNARITEGGAPTLLQRLAHILWSQTTCSLHPNCRQARLHHSHQSHTNQRHRTLDRERTVMEASYCTARCLRCKNYCRPHQPGIS